MLLFQRFMAGFLMLTSAAGILMLLVTFLVPIAIAAVGLASVIVFCVGCVELGELLFPNDKAGS